MAKNSDMVAEQLALLRQLHQRTGLPDTIWSSQKQHGCGVVMAGSVVVATCTPEVATYMAYLHHIVQVLATAKEKGR